MDERVQGEGAVAMSARRPHLDRIGVRFPFVFDFAASVFLRLRPGSALRRRGLALALRTAWDAINRGDFEPARLAYDSDAEVFLFGADGLGLAKSYTGERGWAEFIGDIFENFGEPRFTPQRVRDGGDRIVVEIALAATGKVSGVPVQRSVGTAYYFSRRGKITRQEVFWERGSWELALEAAGLTG